MKKLILLAVVLVSGAVGNAFAGSGIPHSKSHEAGNDEVFDIGPKPGRPVPPNIERDLDNQIGPRPGQPIPHVF